MRCLPDFPAAPQLPARDPREGMLAQWLGALPEVRGRAATARSSSLGDVRRRARVRLRRPRARRAARVPRRRAARSSAHRSASRSRSPGRSRSGSRCTRPACPQPRAFRRAAEVARAWSVAIEELVDDAAARHRLVLFFDEPALVAWRRGDAPLDRESAIDVLSGALAAVDCVTGVHVCGDGDVGLALEAGPAGARCRGERRPRARHRRARALPRRRRLDRVGRGAHRPAGRRVGRSALAHAGARVVRADASRVRSGAAAHARA